MASGRLGSAVIPSKRTTVVYDNTSGGSASISIMAKMRSSTSNGTISIVLDSSATAAETVTQIDSSSYNKEALKLFYNSGTTATTGKLEYTNYNTTAHKELKITDFSNSSVTTFNDAMYANPQWTSTDYADWGVISSHVPVVNGGYNDQLYVRFVTLANQTAFGGLAFSKRLLNNGSASPTVAFTRSNANTYGGFGGCTDLYCDRVPTFNSGTGDGYMSAVWLHTNGAQGDTGAYATNSLYRTISTTNHGSNYERDKFIFASGGIAIFTHRDNDNFYFVCYGRTGASNNRIQQVVSGHTTSSGSSYPYHYKANNANNQSQTGTHDVNFFEYNPNTGKSYALIYWGGGRKLLEFDVAKWEEALAADAGNTASSDNSYAETVSAGLVTDISSLAPSDMLNNATLMAGPVVRNGKSNWLIPIKNGTTHTIYQTTDFKSYSVYSSTSNYSESVTDDLSVASTGSVTNSIANNYNSLDKGGAIEHDTSFNQLERTGLVISDNDRVIVRNGGSSDLSVQVMGYEE